MSASYDYDIIIVGAGPAGLCFARSLAGSGLRLALIEPQSAAQLADPPFDGREIALTHHSAHLLTAMGIWPRIPAEQIHPLRDARVLDGAGQVDDFVISHHDGRASQLGYLIANHLIRRAAYAAVADQADLTLLVDLRCSTATTNADGAQVRVSDGRTLSARLLVAADSRYSETRRAMGIGASMQDFGRTMLVCRMRHALAHEETAWEWFGHGQTLALLPLAEGESSVVLTLPHPQIQALLDASESEFNQQLSARFEQRLGAMELSSSRHAYPLVGVYPQRFVAPRFALIGDAAVGMHPVTAHGFNLGLLGQDLLAGAMLAARRQGTDWAHADLLAQYERRLWLATRPLYLATRAIVGLYTSDHAPARLLRRAGLTLGARAPWFRRLLAAGLTQSGDSLSHTRPLSALIRSLTPESPRRIK